MAALKSLVEYLTNVVNNLTITVYRDSPLTSSYRDSTIITPLEERSSYSLPFHTNNSKKNAGETIVGRKLFDRQTDRIIDLYSTYEPVYGINVGLKARVKIPEWLPVIYKPPENIILNQVEAAVGAYIYADSNCTGLEGNEVLVRTKDKKFSADRKGLKTLQPMGWVDQDQILLICDRDKQKGDLISWYKDSHMGRIDKVKKIFIPVNDEGKHWYLAMVDIPQRTVFILNSLPCPSRDFDRKRNVQKFVLTLDEMLLRDEFQSECELELGLSEFKYIWPDNVGKQADDS